MIKKCKRIKGLIFIISLILISAISCYVENNWIETEYIKVEVNNFPKELSGLKIAHLSDVHLPKNASSIDNIILKIKSQSPDLILLTGDIIDESADIENCGLDKLCEGLSEIAQTYAISGNHEVWNNNLERWTKILTNNNVKVIDNQTEVYVKHSKSIAIVGLKDEYELKQESVKDLEKAKGIPMILVAHRPELFSSYFTDSSSVRPSIVFTGHAHGGQFRIPFFNKGVVAPNQGFLPKYTSGFYLSKGNEKMIISRGLGNSIIPIRINNRPHLPIVELVNPR